MRLAILNTDPKECSYGGVAPIIRNMHPYLADAFDVRYFNLPDSIKRLPGPDRIKIVLYLIFHFREIKKADFILSHILEGSFIASFTGVHYAHIYHGNSNPMDVSRYWFGKYFAFVYNIFFRRIEKTADFRYSIGPAESGVKKLLNPIRHEVTVKPVEARSGFIYAGRLESPKNIDRIIRIYSKLPLDIRQKNSLYIAGTGTKKEELMQLVRQMSLESSVLFLGQLDNRALIEEVSSHLLLLMASTVEGMPTAIAEALSVGVPVVAVEAGDIPAVISNNRNGFLLKKEYEDEEYVGAIIKALDRIDELSSFAKKSSLIFDAGIVTQGIIDDILSIS